MVAMAVSYPPKDQPWTPTWFRSSRVASAERGQAVDLVLERQVDQVVLGGPFPVMVAARCAAPVHADDDEAVVGHALAFKILAVRPGPACSRGRIDRQHYRIVLPRFETGRRMIMASMSRVPARVYSI
jgi:hypothetical protein